ncbi:MAG: hypothetical protein QXO17_02045 [Nitrososphaerota archaeon]|nr:hypothetical protein [Candidatus Calditenuis fumarioli]
MIAEGFIGWTVVTLGIVHGVNPSSGWLLGVYRALISKSLRELALSISLLSLGHMLSSVLSLALSAPASHLRWWTVVTAAAALTYGAWRLLRPSHPYLGLKRGRHELLCVGLLLGMVHGSTLSLAPLISAWCSRFGGGLAVLTSALTFTVIHSFVAGLTMMVAGLLVYRVLGLGALRRIWVNYNLIWSVTLIVIASYVILSVTLM